MDRFLVAAQLLIKACLDTNMLEGSTVLTRYFFARYPLRISNRPKIN